MSVPWIASLRTGRAIERGVSYYGATEESVTTSAKKWLDSVGQHGDAFVVTENVPIVRETLWCEKLPVPEPVRELKGHAFKSDPKQPLKCEMCAGEYGEHV